MPPFRSILVAADFSESSREAFRIACSLAQTGEAQFTVVHAEPPPIVSGELGVPITTAHEDRVHREELGARLREFYAPDGPRRVEYLVRDGFAADQVLRAADEVGADLVVMGTHGRTGLGRMLMGSVAEAVLRQARCPVLTVRSALAGGGPSTGVQAHENASP